MVRGFTTRVLNFQAWGSFLQSFCPPLSPLCIPSWKRTRPKLQPRVSMFYASIFWSTFYILVSVGGRCVTGNHAVVAAPGRLIRSSSFYTIFLLPFLLRWICFLTLWIRCVCHTFTIHSACTPHMVRETLKRCVIKKMCRIKKLPVNRVAVSLDWKKNEIKKTVRVKRNETHETWASMIPRASMADQVKICLMPRKMFTVSHENFK